jgi:hypothetical protein
VDLLLIGLDLNATRARAASGVGAESGRPLPLDGSHMELPVAISLEGRRPEVGRAGVALCRQSPHLVCLDFLASLDTPRQWVAGRHRLDAAAALALVCDRLRPACAGVQGLALALPSYLSPAQVTQLAQVTARARLPVLGSVTAPLAAVLAAHSLQPFSGPAVVLDVDDHCLTLNSVVVDDDQARVHGEQHLPRLALPAWKHCVLDGVAERCVRHSRRDPRDSAPAEQSLYDQLDEAFEACRQGRMVEVAIQAAQWFQGLVLQPAEILAWCAKPVRQTLDAVRQLCEESAFQAPGRVVLTDAASRLPGLAAALQAWVEEQPAEPEAPATEDFGEDLLESPGGPGSVVSLPADAVAGAAHDLAVRFHRGELGHSHLSAAAPVVVAVQVDAGPARLHFCDRDYPLHGLTFTLGRQPGCDLVFDSATYPSVSGRHCEIVYDRRAYVLRDRSRNGTLINDRPVAQQATLHPGDWIRLGPDGPVLRFLGQATDAPHLGTTA